MSEPARDLMGRLPPEYRCDPTVVHGCKGHPPKGGWTEGATAEGEAMTTDASNGRDVGWAVSPASETPGPLIPCPNGCDGTASLTGREWSCYGKCGGYGTLSETPGPGEGDLRGEDVTTELLTGALGEIDRLRDAIRDIDAGRVRDVDEVRRERDAAEEQRTLAEQKVLATLEAQMDAADAAGEFGECCRDADCRACNVLVWMHDRIAALADPEADR